LFIVHEFNEFNELGYYYPVFLVLVNLQQVNYLIYLILELQKYATSCVLYFRSSVYPNTAFITNSKTPCRYFNPSCTSVAFLPPPSPFYCIDTAFVGKLQDNLVVILIHRALRWAFLPPPYPFNTLTDAKIKENIISEEKTPIFNKK